MLSTEERVSEKGDCGPESVTQCMALSKLERKKKMAEGLASNSRHVRVTL
ncbi:hypothetical protein CC1G_15057 [Coprinopsis cinerea okayama7|uniref:Uncharacterized protein n=1 Tax=Coprinopsis cinerea (strain Okayama-7 / 130 / ATCC MYA-4618 / FGSC 9003) TaxID=240176 RepID=D6RP42_COPC7|nr:hypothetical protein CC1G_15057 [Coprinopsis cinerea okayama7\|eukprot:XP_002910723.1 hypothetical protein CC1G_15057 [Coprinopsis cinerea okayama7\